MKTINLYGIPQRGKLRFIKLTRDDFDVNEGTWQFALSNLSAMCVTAPSRPSPAKNYLIDIQCNICRENYWVDVQESADKKTGPFQDIQHAIVKTAQIKLDAQASVRQGGIHSIWCQNFPLEWLNVTHPQQELFKTFLTDKRKGTFFEDPDVYLFLTFRFRRVA